MYQCEREIDEAGNNRNDVQQKCGSETNEWEDEGLICMNRHRQARDGDGDMRQRLIVNTGMMRQKREVKNVPCCVCVRARMEEKMIMRSETKALYPKQKGSPRAGT